MKNKISKIIILMITFALLACIPTKVLADGQIDLEQLTGNTTGNTTEDDSTEDEEIPDLSGEITTNTNTETNTNTNTNTDTNTNTNNNTNTDSSTSTYEESDIPYAGPEDTILMVSAFAVLLIIGIYTFVKMSEYSNI